MPPQIPKILHAQTGGFSTPRALTRWAAASIRIVAKSTQPIRSTTVEGSASTIRSATPSSGRVRGCMGVQQETLAISTRSRRQPRDGAARLSFVDCHCLLPRLRRLSHLRIRLPQSARTTSSSTPRVLMCPVVATRAAVRGIPERRSRTARRSAERTPPATPSSGLEMASTPACAT